MGPLSRRQFLAASSLAATSAALAPRAFADRNDVLRVAVTGVRGRGMDHLKALLALKGVEIAAICDVNENIIGKAMKAVEDKQGKKPVFYQDFRKLVEDKSIDAVTIATSNHTHALLAIWGLQAGKHVYVEKPVSHNVWEGRKIVEAARKYNKIFQTGTQSRSFKGFRESFKFLQEGKLGKIQYARGLCYNPRPSIGIVEDTPVPAGIDYNLWLGPAPERPFNSNRFFYNWHWFWDYGNGDLGNQGVHQLDLIRWGLGYTTLPKKVLSVGGRFGYKDDGETANSQIVAFDYGDKPQILFEVRGLPTNPYKEVKVGAIFHCTDGRLALSRSEATAYDKAGEVIQKFTGTGDHFQNFVDAVRSGKPSDLAADIEEGHLSSALCHLGNISYRLGGLHAMYKVRPFGDSEDAADTYDRFKEHMNANGVQPDNTQIVVGRTLTVDAKAERFVDDSEADKMLTREYRKPFVVPDAV
ncbi:MAG: gfo/Idh/MocA family oxidoreductase [Planctomycetota bacterium]|nr:MAG: gfo/Idh/MocA family oxidoreductase [Planctomycetota bacterium]